MKKTVLLLAGILLLALGAVMPAAAADPDDQAEVRKAAALLREIVRIPEKGMPPALLGNARGIAIIPGVIKVGFVIGGRRGSGIVLVRKDNGDWGTPSRITLTAGSLGWQIGVQSTDVILVFKTRKSVEGLMGGKFTLGADAGVAAGPVGRGRDRPPAQGRGVLLLEEPGALRRSLPGRIRPPGGGKDPRPGGGRRVEETARPEVGGVRRYLASELYLDLFRPGRRILTLELTRDASLGRSL